ncbi:aminomethyl-transferring glycine dehydrogenase subunit GcvPA [Micavibrio aeruginosavorus]|uniref:Glycine dehydrogenase [decarboxylating] (Glycine cleavage system P1 protein) n=1 Tax=Micavibrio aeruginosavorus EPB TaxID=349215 RepID=M4VJC3_9BACT|nr:aminomethyl-transferring glycine dehydrogenase subunit GcvPA [Micavibrio aeruginosavorus]AGH98151.1 Glycine dehydrogenase [decarboxylating] (glycine cleavage system P1 protein) [Micavibrio aeruginosavorus EPB]
MRYLPQTQNARKAMLDAIGVASVDDLFVDVPAKARMKGAVDLPPHMGELAVERALSAYANQNRAAGAGPFFLGAGCYYHHVPASVDYIIQRSEFLTAYTPYQPEIAQGTLTAIFEFQTFIAQLTGQDIANASMYDGATSCTEAALMAMRLTGRGRVIVGNDLHPHYWDVLKSGVRGCEQKTFKTITDDESDVACIIVQCPDFLGQPVQYADWRALCDRLGAKLVVVINEIVSLGLLPAPSMADIVCGEAQSIGLAMGFGGPHLGFFACRTEYVRQMPGRLVGETVDADGKRAFVLTLNTREQHIRREKATSNICTNQGLCALAFTVHMGLLGEGGFKQLARINHERAGMLADALAKVPGVKVVNETFFNEFVVELSKPSAGVVDQLAAKGIIAGLALDGNRLLVAATEMTEASDIDAFCNALAEVLK